MKTADEIAKEMKEAAEQATTGEWYVLAIEGFDEEHVDISCDSRVGYVPICTVRDGSSQNELTGYPAVDEQPRNARHIAASNPANVLALCDAFEALKTSLAELEREQDQAAAIIEADNADLISVNLENVALTTFLAKAVEALKPFSDIGNYIDQHCPDAPDSGETCSSIDTFRFAANVYAEIAAATAGPDVKLVGPL